MWSELPSNVPTLPAEVLALSPDILEELLCYEHIKRVHGSRNCYKGGCGGPLCRYGDRKYQREYYAKQRARAGKTHTPSELRRDKREQEFEAALLVYQEHQKVIEIVSRLADLYSEMRVTA